MDAAGFRNGGKQSRADREIGFVEAKKPDIAANQRGSGILSQGGHDHLLITDALPDQSAKQRDRGAIVVHQVPPETSADAALELDSLFGALQEVGEAGVIPIIPAEEALYVEVDLIARGG